MGGDLWSLTLYFPYTSCVINIFAIADKTKVRLDSTWHYFKNKINITQLMSVVFDENWCYKMHSGIFVNQNAIVTSVF